VKDLIHTLRLIHFLDYAGQRPLMIITLITVLTCGGLIFMVKTDRLIPGNALALEVAIGKVDTATFNVVSDHKTGPVQIQISPELKPFIFVSENPLESGNTVAGETYSIKLTMAAAPDAKPGIYKGTLSLPGYDDQHITLTVSDPCEIGPDVPDTDGNGIADNCDNFSSIAHISSSFSIPRGADNTTTQKPDDITKPKPGQIETGDDGLVDSGDSAPSTPIDTDDTSMPKPDQAGNTDDNAEVADTDDPSPSVPETTVTGDPLAVKHANRTPTRLMQGGPDGNFYVSDAHVNSVFVYSPDLKLVGEIEAPPRPLGVAVDTNGNVYIGSDTNNTVDLYDQSGTHIQTVVSGVQMPTDLALDDADQLYVVDSLSDTVKIYGSNGIWLRDLGLPGDGPGQLKFPVAVAISDVAAEIYVADQGHGLIQVYDMQGAFLRSYGGLIEAFSSESPGKFVKLQSLAVDDLGRLHALDNYFNNTQILDATTGAFIESYGGYGSDAGKLNVPLDLWISTTGEVAITNSGNHQVEYIYTVSGE
jgi:hypothetical protein